MRSSGLIGGEKQRVPLLTNESRFVLIYETLRQSTRPGVCPCFALRLMSFFAIYLGKIRVHEGNKCSSERGLAFGGRAELIGIDQNGVLQLPRREIGRGR